MTALLALCAALAAAASARSAATVVPARIDAAVLLDGSEAAAGLRPFLEGVERRAPALAPAARLAAAVGPDLLANPLSWGLARSGPRAVVVANGAVALSAPVRDAKAARASLDAWLREWGPVRTRAVASRASYWSGDARRARVGLVTQVAGSLRLVTASGAQDSAFALAAALSQIGARRAATPPLSSDRVFRSALAGLTRPAALVLRGSDPLRGAALDLAGPADGLVATGLLLAPAPLLSSHAPGAEACSEAGALLCLRAALGPSGREVLELAGRTYLAAILGAQERAAAARVAQRAAAAADRLVVRSDGADANLLTEYTTPLPALRLWAATSPAVEASIDAGGARPSCIRSDKTSTWFATPCLESGPADLAPVESEPSLDARLDLVTVDGVLQKLTPLDVIRGGLAGALYAGRLTLGGLLRRSGPLRLRGNAHPSGAEVEFRWPLR